MINHTTDILPKVMNDELLRLYRADPDWITFEDKGVHDRHFAVRLKQPTFLEQYWHDGNDYLSQYGMSKFLGDGPKIFRPTVEQCRAFENIEVKLMLEDYAQPYPAILIDPPSGLYEPFSALLLFHRGDWLCCTLFSPDHQNDITTVMKKCPDEMEVDLTLFRPDAQQYVEIAPKLYRVGVNACLALTNYGFQKEILFKKQVESDRQLANEQSERGRRARERVKQAISIVSFTREITLHETRGDRSAGEESGNEMSAHWRRGHWRMQPHGPANSLRKRILIKPVLVRADKFIGDLADTFTKYKT